MSADPDVVREFHRHFATGVTVVTTSDGGEPRGLAVNAFASLSLEPPLVLVCVAKQAVTYEKLFMSHHFAVNILAGDQADVAAVFAQSGGDKFSRVAWQSGTYGSPILDGVAAHLEAEIVKRIPAYTHTVFVGSVVDASTSSRPPLVYLGGRFFDADVLQETPQPTDGKRDASLDDAERNRQLLFEAWRVIDGERRFDAFDRYFAEDYVRHSADGVSTREDFRKTIEELQVAFPDHNFKIDEVVAAADKVVYRWTMSGTHLGIYKGVPPTNSPIVTSGMTISRIENGRFVEDWFYKVDVLHSLGIIPIDT